MPLDRHAAIPLREIAVRTSRSSGPGGQHANVTASRVEAVFDVAASSALSEAQKRRVIARTGPRVVAVAQDARGQARNPEPPPQPLQRRLIGALAPQAPRPRPNAADDEIMRRLKARPEPGAVRVVTSDRWLADQAWATGASVEGSESFRIRLDER